VAIAGVIPALHVIWLFKNDFMPVRYALARAHSQPLLINHLVNPLEFALSQALALVPMIIMLEALMFGSRLNPGGDSPEKFPRTFLFTAALGPFLAFLAISAIIGFKLRSMWGTPLWSFIGVFILYHVRPALPDKALHRFTYACLSFAAIWVVLFVGQFALKPRLIGRPMRGHFPGQAIADYVTT
jgi:hypothetical protein